MTSMSIAFAQSTSSMDTTTKRSAPEECCCTQPGGLAPRLTREVEVTGTKSTQPPASEGAALARLDGCPACVANSEVPYGLINTPNCGQIAVYHCTDCGHRWHTSWAA